MRYRWWIVTGMLLVLAGCAGAMVGVYRGPEPFGGKEYNITPPRVNLAGTVKVVVLLLADERPPLEHELDWVRQAHPFGDTLGQPKEVRNELDRAIKSGLSANPGIRLVSPETFLETRDADLIISGRIFRCEVEKKIGITTVDFHGRANMEIVLRNGQGITLGAGLLAFAEEVRVPWSPPTMDSRPDEIPPGYSASAMEKTIRLVVESFLASSELADALTAAQEQKTINSE